MYERTFGFCFKIVGAKSKKLYDDRVPMSDSEGKAFVDAIDGMFDKITDKPIGLDLISEIEKAQKQVIIYSDDNSGKGSAALPYPCTAQNETNRFVKLRQIPDVAAAALKKQNPGMVLPTLQNYAALVHSTIESAKANRDVAATVLGISRRDLDDVEYGRQPLKPEAYHRFAMYFYDHLEPGEGSTVALRFDRQQAGPDDPEFNILGHELIHVWRMVTGMRIFQGGWEEEAMTTGVPPFVAMKFTENKIRAEHGLALRTKYGARCETAHYQTVSGMKGVWPEHVRIWCEWKDAHPKQVLSPAQGDGFAKPFKRIKNISGPTQTLYNR
jgi:hypothetical protein